jgi:hypothetical protein
LIEKTYHCHSSKVKLINEHTTSPKDARLPGKWRSLKMEPTLVRITRTGKLKAKSGTRFSYWELRLQARDDQPHQSARGLELKPLFPPKRVFIPGYPGDREFEIAYGFLNLKDENHRRYFAANYKVYGAGYLLREGISPDTEWGMRVENHMSGGAVVDDFGNLVGVVVNGGNNTAGILSIENILATFFPKVGKAGAAPAILLAPKNTPLYLRENPTE